MPYPNSYPVLILLLLSLACSTTEGNKNKSTSHESIPAQLDHYLDSLHQAHAFNGSVLLAEGDSIIFDQHYGYANAESQDSLTQRSSYRLASVSKQFTATAILMLQQDGKLNVDDLVQKYLPELPYKDVTIRHLLTHTSGLPDYISLLDSLWDASNPVDKKKTAFNADALSMLVSHQPSIEFAPGEAWSYSNTGYVLLALIVERTSGKSIGEFLKEKVFDPLRMSDTRAFSPDETFQVAHRVYGFAYDSNSGYKDNDWNYLNGMVGDGGFYSSTRDLFIWDQALYRDRFLIKTSKEEAFSPYLLNNGEKSDYGFGWGINTENPNKKIVQHSGGWLGARTFFRRELDARRTLILLSNYSADNMREVLQRISYITQ